MGNDFLRRPSCVRKLYGLKRKECKAIGELQGIHNMNAHGEALFLKHVLCDKSRVVGAGHAACHIDANHIRICPTPCRKKRVHIHADIGMGAGWKLVRSTHLFVKQLRCEIRCRQKCFGAELNCFRDEADAEVFRFRRRQVAHRICNDFNLCHTPPFPIRTAQILPIWLHVTL